MKKYLLPIVTIAFLCTSLVALGNQQFRLLINGRDVKTDMIVKDGVTYLPLRTISNELGMDLQFNDGVISLNTSISYPSVVTPSLPPTTTSSTPVVTTPIEPIYKTTYPEKDKYPDKPIAHITATENAQGKLSDDELLQLAKADVEVGARLKGYQNLTIGTSEVYINDVGTKCVLTSYTYTKGGVKYSEQENLILYAEQNVYNMVHKNGKSNDIGYYGVTVNTKRIN